MHDGTSVKVDTDDDNESEQHSHNEAPPPRSTNAKHNKVKMWSRDIAETAAAKPTCAVRATGRTSTVDRHTIRKAVSHGLRFSLSGENRSPTTREAETETMIDDTARTVGITHHKQATFAAIELMIGCEVPTTLSTEDAMKIIAHLAIRFDPPLDEVDTTAIFKAAKAATINIANDIRAAQERDENADMPDSREDPSDIVNKPQCWERFVEGPTAREKLDRLAREMERFFLTGGEWKPADKDRHTRLTSKFEGKRLISIAKDLLQPADSATDKTAPCKRNTTNALVNIWERLQICHAVLELTYSASIHFAQAVEASPPDTKKDYYKMWQDANQKYPITAQLAAWANPRLGAQGKRKRPGIDNKWDEER